MKYKGVLLFLVLAVSMLILGTPLVQAEESEVVIFTLPEKVQIQGSGGMLLGKIGELTGPADLVAEVAQVNAGAAPVAGSSRRLTKGQIQVRLRQAGIDVSKVEFQGSEVVQIHNSALGQEGKAPVTTTLVASYEVVVVVRDLARGEILQKSDLATEERELRSNQVDGRELSEFVGLRTTRTLNAGTVLTNLNVEIVPTIERGNQITIIVQTPALLVTAPGIARGSGNLGEVIAVENTLSKQVVYGEIVDSETVMVNIRGSVAP